MARNIFIVYVQNGEKIAIFYKIIVTKYDFGRLCIDELKVALKKYIKKRY